MELLRVGETSAGMTSKIKRSLRSQTPPVSGTDRSITYSDHIKTRHLIMSSSKFFDDAKGDCSDENIGDRSDAQNQELVNDQISDPNQSVDAANSSPSGTPAGGDVPFPSMNNHQLQMSVEPEKNLNLNFQCGRMKKAQKRQKRILDGEKEKGIGLADMAANLSKILLNCGT
uniref:Uncharacterized protein n=1 Tax=Salix viminalis TaxID=40686 RepID=A0A6N2M7S2_SALVM